MPSKFISTIGPQNFHELIKNATHRILVSLPNIHDELADCLISANSNVKDIRVTIDNSENNFRNGYGSVNAVVRLKNNGVSIFECEKNRISFVICDEEGYFLFPESRIFGYDDIGLNAVKMDPLTQVHLIEYFFPEPSKKSQDQSLEIKEKVTHVADVYIKFFEETIDDLEEPKSTVKVTQIDEEKLETVKEKLKENPPTHPDLQRQIKTYTAKFQFVEMIFEGANLHIKKVKIPPKAMPFKDKEIKKALETKMRLFEDLEQNEKFKAFFNLKDDIGKIRKEYFTPITSRKKSLIKINEKEAFKTKLEGLKIQIKDLNKAIFENLDAEILSSKQKIRTELKTFLTSNPPEEIKDYQPDLFVTKIDDIISGILNSIKYPDPQKILSKVSIKENFYDLTFDDFKDTDFLEEIENKGIMEKGEIEEIVTFKKAFEAKP